MMGKATRTNERAIWRTKAGRYELRVVNSKGSQKRAKITVDTLAEALAMREVAEQARKEGGSARVAWASMRGIDGTRVRRVKIDEMFKRYLDHGDKLVSQGGDHKDPAPRSGSAEIRRATTQRGYRRNVKLVKRLIAEVGVGYADEMTADKLEEVRNEMADRGLAKNTQQSRLFHVRKALEHLDAGEQPEGFPNDHKKVKPLKPGKPRKRAPNPAKWGGTYGDDPPALPLHEAFDIAEEMGPERGLAVYLMVLMGLRRGEALGVTLEKISHEGGRLYITIEDQRFEKKIEEQAKTTASYRKLPVPEVMKAALVGYCRGLHGWDPTGDQNPPDPSSPLVLSPTRKIEAPMAWVKAFRGAFQECRVGYDDLGYELTPHHLRKTCSAQILGAQQTAARESGRREAEMQKAFVVGDEDELLRLIEMHRVELDALGVTKESLLQLGMQVPQVNASSWLGHKIKGNAGAPFQAAAVTLDVYNPTLTALDPLEATADWLTFAARFDKWVAYNKTMLFVAVATLMGNPPAGDRLSEGSVKTLGEEAKQHADRAERLAPEPDAPLFVPNTGSKKVVTVDAKGKEKEEFRGFTYRQLRYWMLLLNKGAGLRERTPHALRHTAGVQLAVDGVPMNVIQGLLGHASVATTGIYTELAAGELVGALDRTEANSLLGEALKRVR